ncbi:UDP-glucose 6-dehydrogenase AglM [Halococcus sediminicola]|uniref:UDP-glucose 6-dehydrogenase AglM n=1 Tax=Halococcus sediminicola TaxID=1264579 RepID=UPI0006786C70|nr:UDP-glucose 6-dehydrogenase AglM [Halococcus sediminicola]
MNVSVVGSGYVGTTVAACLADLGHRVTAIDIDTDIVDTINAGETPIHEPGLAELVETHAGTKLTATTDHAALRETDITFLALQTPSREDGSIDLGALEAGTRDVGEALAEKEGYHLVVVKSTVIPGTVEERLEPLLEEVSGKKAGQEFGVAVNPEFQSQGSAVADFMGPDKLVFGAEDERALDRLDELYEPLVADNDGIPIVETGRREAMMVKYANNVFLAGKISLINELGNLCKEFGVDSYEVAEAIGLDERISSQFLRSGVGWGGSCFPKDTDALRAAGREAGYTPELLDSVVAVNDGQPRRMLELLERHIDVEDRRIAVLGLAFKPGTDDIRGSRATLVIDELLDRGAEVAAYDPVASDAMAEKFPDVEYVESAGAALTDAHGALVVTDWDEFAALDGEFDDMEQQIVVDGRRIVDSRDGMTYEGLTW